MKYDSLIDINDGAFDMFDFYSGRRLWGNISIDDDVMTSLRGQILLLQIASIFCGYVFLMLIRTLKYVV